MKRATTIIAAACAASLTLVGCGNSEEETGSGGLSTQAQAPSETATETTTDATVTETEGTPTDGDIESSGENNREPNRGRGDAAPDRQEQQSGNQAQRPAPAAAPGDFTPLESSDAGTDEDREQMTQAMNAVLNPPSFSAWTRTLIDNSCSEVADEARNQLEQSGFSLEQVEEAAREQESLGNAITVPASRVTLTDVRVDGDRASATAKVSTDGAEDTEAVQRFAREDGRWKVCNA